MVWACPACQAEFSVPEGQSEGTRIRCPRCQRVGDLEPGREGRATRARGGWLPRPGLALAFVLGLATGAAPVVVWSGATAAPGAEPAAPDAGLEPAGTPSPRPSLREDWPPALVEGRRLLEAGDGEGAAAVLQRAASATGSAEAHKVLARALRRLRRFEEAERTAARYREARRPLAP